MSQHKSAEVSEAEIAVHWQEEAQIHPSKKFVAQANLVDQRIFERFSLDNFPDYFKEYADLLHWYRPWDVTLDTSNPPFWRWFVGGRINASYNCVDRHAASWRKTKAAIIWEGEPGEERVLTYRDLYREVNRAAAALRSLGVQKGDRVAIYMPMIPEAPAAMLACARIGAPHSVVFGGFSSDALRDRINDAEARLLITADGAWRRGQIVPLKESSDTAMADTPSIERCLVVKRTG